MINLTVGFREIQVWTQNNYGGGDGTSVVDPLSDDERASVDAQEAAAGE